jgi:integrase/recombinase XerD
MKTLTVTNRSIKRQPWVSLSFPYDEELKKIVKTIPCAKWDPLSRAWLIPHTSSILDDLHVLFNTKAQLDVSHFKSEAVASLPPSSTEHLQHLEHFTVWMKVRRYSDSTIKTYREALRIFLGFTDATHLAEITSDDVMRFNHEYILKRKLSASFQNQVLNAIKLFFRTIPKTPIELGDIDRPKRPKKLPEVLSKEEVREILNAPTNPKHRAMLSMIYACGLRRSELVALTLRDIDSHRKIVTIRQAKGRKDRIVPVSEKLIELLRAYYIAYRPKTWLFEGQKEGEPYSSQSLQNVLKQAARKASIRKPVTLHWLRHSYATHLLENGTDLRYIQELLGHSSSRTTEIYTHVSTKSIQNIKSPFDDL